MAPPLPAPPPTGPDPNTITLISANQYGGLHFGMKNVALEGISIDPTSSPVRWQLQMTHGGRNLSRNRMEVEDILLVLGYEWE